MSEYIRHFSRDWIFLNLNIFSVNYSNNWIYSNIRYTQWCSIKTNPSLSRWYQGQEAVNGFSSHFFRKEIYFGFLILSLNIPRDSDWYTEQLQASLGSVNNPWQFTTHIAGNQEHQKSKGSHSTRHGNLASQLLKHSISIFK